jgi:serine/threonine-protein kinase
MATVYLAEDERLGRQVAIKRLRAESSEDAAARFRREAQLGAALNHPNLVTVFDILVDEEAVLIVMEYVEGTDLDLRLKKREPLGEEKSLRILRSVAAGLDHAHQRGVVHRDVKPSNILLADRGEAKLTDLGVAKVLEDTSATRAGAMPGTPLYMAPEQLEGKRVTEATDVYSLALIAYQMLSGQNPRGGGTIPEIAHQAVNNPAPDLREAWPQAPEQAAAVLCRAMDRDPGARPLPAARFVDELEAALGGGVAEPSGAEATVTMPVAVPEPVAPIPDPTPAEPEPPKPPSEPSSAPPVPPPSPPSRARPAGRKRSTVALLLASLAVAGVLALLVIGADDSGDSPERGGGAAEAGKSGQGGEGAPADSSQGEPAVDPGDPALAVQTFYELVAADDYAGASDLTSPAFRAEIGGFGGFDTLESIEFKSLGTTSETPDNAEVSFSTIASHSGFTDTCTGTIALVSGGDNWLLDDPVAIDCQRS